MGLVVERAGFGKVVKRLPKVAGNLYLLLFVVIGWVLFRAPDLEHRLAFNKFLGARRAEPVWRVDDDISRLLILGDARGAEVDWLRKETMMSIKDR